MIRNVCLLFVLLWLSLPVMAKDSGFDSLTTRVNPHLCLTAESDSLSGTRVRMLPCRNLMTQNWQIDSEGKWHIQANPDFCLGLQGDDIWYNPLLVLPCTDRNVYGFTAQPQDDGSVLYTLDAENDSLTFALDSAVKPGAQAILYNADASNPNQQWRWLQSDLQLAKAEGCDISYPFPADDANSYQREMACDRLSRIQPPGVIPDEALRTTIFPGAAATELPRITRTFDFDLNFKDQSYLRIWTPPSNWLNTGLYALPYESVRIAASSENEIPLDGLFVQIGVHSDLLNPYVDNVAGGEFLRHPNVTIQLPLTPGEMRVRSPYGGPIVLISEQSVKATIQVTIGDAVEMPYLNTETTTAEAWLAQRDLAIPYASLESRGAVVFVPTSEVSALSYEEARSVAEYYTTIGNLHNQLVGLEVNNIALHQPPQGKYWHVADRQISYGWAYAGFPIMYFNEIFLGTPDATVNAADGTWGQYHELGHNYQMEAWSGVYGVEVTVNLFSLHAEELLIGRSRLNDEDVYRNAITLLDDPTIEDKWNADGNPDPFIQLVFLDQIRLGFPELDWQIWTTLMRRYREMPQTEWDGLLEDEQLQHDRFMTLLCEITQTNLTPHFEAWTIAVSQDAKATCAAYPSLAEEIWHLGVE